MVFSSLTFLYVFLLVLLVLHSMTYKNQQRNTLLLVFSLFFYAWGEPIWVFLMILDAFVAWICAGRVDKIYAQAALRSRTFSATALAQQEQKRDAHGLTVAERRKVRFYFVSGVSFCAALLLIFKYTGFFLSGLNLIPFIHLPIPNIRLPIGISFFTFQIITYIVDVYRRDAAVQKRFPDLLLYVCLFPQLIAGPIVRYADVAEQINHRRVTTEKIVSGIERFLIGLAKKAILANYAGQIVRDTLETRLGQLTALEAWLGLLAYAFQIYFDFSAYSDMAIGLGRMFGFEFLENFNYPYISKSITEFWRRWHMSLGTFFRDYVYIPLGGKYHKQLRNIIVVWLLTGFWHGASLNFLLWGLYYAILLVIEKYFFLKVTVHWPAFIKRALTFFLVLMGWGFFYFTDFSKMGLFFQTLLGLTPYGFSSQLAVDQMRGYMFFFLLLGLAATPIPTWLYQHALRFFWRQLGGVYDPSQDLGRTKKLLRSGFPKDLPRPKERPRVTSSIYTIYLLFKNALLLLASTAALVSASYNPFLYFRF